MEAHYRTEGAHSSQLSSSGRLGRSHETTHRRRSAANQEPGRSLDVGLFFEFLLVSHALQSSLATAFENFVPMLHAVFVDWNRILFDSAQPIPHPTTIHNRQHNQNHGTRHEPCHRFELRSVNKLRSVESTTAPTRRSTRRR